MTGFTFPYRSAGYSEHGIFTELYLPKHARFQGMLYDTLTRGFDHELVRAHFLDHSKRPRIAQLFERHSRPQWTNYTDEYVETLKSLYWGYSLYEVDGVFKRLLDSDGTDKPASQTRDYAIDEERTQVMRIMFLPGGLDERLTSAGVPLGGPEHKRIRNLVAEIIRTPDPGALLSSAEASDRTLHEFVHAWFNAVGFFLIGYVVFEICAGITDRVAADEAEHEKEIWLTSFWNFTVNRFTLQSRD